MTEAERDATQLSDDDRRDLIDLMTEYVWRLDHRSADRVHELVTEDVSMAPGPLVGRDAVKAWGKERAAAIRATSHLMTNFRFHVVDADRVECTSMALVFRHDGADMGKASPYAVTEYNDIFVRQGGTWKFASHVTTDFFSG